MEKNDEPKTDHQAEPDSDAYYGEDDMEMDDLDLSFLDDEADED